MCAKSYQSCLTLCEPKDCSPPGSSIHGFSRQAYWSAWPCPSPADLPNPGIKPKSLTFPAVAGGFFTTSTIWEALLLLLLLSCFSCVQLCATPQTAAHWLPLPWDSPDKITGVSCHFLLQCMKVKSESEVAQLCPTLRTWTAAHQAPPSMGFSRQEYWSGVPLSPLLGSPNLPKLP